MPTPSEYGTAGPAMWIPAFLDGCRTVVRTLITDPNSQFVGIRPGSDGKPLGAYRGQHWFYGLYWAGASFVGTGSVEELFFNLGLGIDITRVYAKSPTKDTADYFLQAGELYERAGRVVEILMQPGSAVARACAASFAAMMAAAPGGPYPVNGVYREQFDTPNVGMVRFETPDWIAAVPPASERTPPPVVFVLRLSFTGLKFHKLLSEVGP